MKSKLYWSHFADDPINEQAYQQLERLPLVIVAHDIRSLYNVGALFRTAEGVLLEKIWLTGYTGRPPRKEISKTALGAEEMIPWEHTQTVAALLAELKKAGRTIYGLEYSTGSMAMDQLVLKFPAALVVGNEVDGLPQEVLTACDQV